MNLYWAGSPNYTEGNNGILWLFPHWTAGGFEGSVSTLQNPERQASAHYVIEGDTVAQLVDEANSTWHCGNHYYNMRAISYELVGWTGNPPSYATLDTCAELMAQASRDYFGGAKLEHGVNVKLHREVYPTSCPGETDIEYLINKANELLGGEMASNEYNELNDRLARIESALAGNGSVSSWAKKAWDDCVNRGIVTNNPQQLASKEVVAQMIYNADGVDGKVADWAKDAQKWAKQQGITNGENPEMFEMRQGVWLMLQRYDDKIQKQLKK